MAPKSRFSDAKLREALAWGLGNKATATRLSCAESMIFRARRRLGVASPFERTPRKVRTVECIFLIVAGWDVARLRRRYACDRQCIYEIAWRGGLKVSKSPVRYPDWTDVDRLLFLGVRVKNIARATGHTTESICQRRRAVGAPKRKRVAILRRPNAPTGYGSAGSADSAGVAGWDCLMPHAARGAQEAA